MKCFTLAHIAEIHKMISGNKPYRQNTELTPEELQHNVFTNPL